MHGGKATIPSTDQKLLWGRSGNRCAFPDCDQLLTEGEGSDGLVVGEMAHICGEKSGAARQDATLLPGFVNSYDNLILMCPTHHTIIDKDEATYTVDVLREMKAVREHKANAEPAPMTEFEGKVSVKAKNSDTVTGAKFTKPTRIKSGSSFTVETENVRNVTGVHIGGE